MNWNKNPLVTVYITNHNYGKFLKQSTDSILHQTFQDFELLIVDDGSTDNSKEIIEQFNYHENVFSIFQGNRGLLASCNTAVHLARGKYIMRLDADDYLAPQALEIMVSELERHPEVALIFPDYFIVDEDGNNLGQVQRHDFQKNVGLLDQPAHGACTMIRKAVLDSIGGYDPAFSRQDGYDVWLSITEQYPVRNINLPLFYYRQHASSITTDEEKLLETRSRIKAKHVKRRGLKPLNVLAIVPVRGKLIDPRSNPLKGLGKKLLIDWTIRSAVDSDLVSDIMITTPDNRVIAHTKDKYPDEVLCLHRDRTLAGVNIAIEDTALDALRHYEKDHDSPDAILMLYVESPFRSTMYIDKAIHTLQLYDVDIVDGVKLDDDMFYVHSGNGLEPWHKSRKLRLEREDLYRRVGGLHLIRTEVLVKNEDMLAGRIGHIFLDQQAAFTIKTELDWEIADLIANKEVFHEDVER